MMGVSEPTFTNTFLELEAPAVLVAVNCTVCPPICDAGGTQVNTPLAASNVAVCGRSNTESLVAIPAGSFAATVNEVILPGRADCGPGTMSAGGATAIVIVCCTEYEPKVAVMTPVCFCVKPLVVAWNVITDCPGGTGTDAGGMTCALLVDRLSATPVDVATALSVTWQFTGDPALTDWGVQAMASGLKLTSDTAACADEFCRVAVMVALSS